ncbi:hypothetical protein TCAL_00283 [Tigriopus californicus]|uniref:Uncharacterized protein n=1 Tax=Tigriopus californicus TaxID=6832 RepID=A0A553P209_TIGCA|nr:hypothetical protein TCAL_00283 [Tigriopus californicus]|eukprot:TCALIF_00283-PA protein Name:"Protein of unknown function" AED:0.00 eAED:0.00 QI:25/1/1/1/0.5/0.33/3/165/99
MALLQLQCVLFSLLLVWVPNLTAGTESDHFVKAVVMPMNEEGLQGDGEALILPLDEFIVEDRSAYIVTLCNQNSQCPDGYVCREVREVELCFKSGSELP